VLRIVADTREAHSGVPNLLAAMDDVDLMERRLTIGDYRLGNTAIVERKTVRDLHLTLVTGRFWRQLRQLRSFTWPYLIIEGAPLDAGPVDPRAIRGVCLAAMDLGVLIVWSQDPVDTARWIHRIAARRSRWFERDRPVYAQRPKRASSDVVAEAILAAVPGVSVKRARALISAFGSVREIALASARDLVRVDGVGEKTATAIAEAFSSHSCVSGNGQNRAT
jgi:ERCC4-type nuclease